MLFDDCLIDGKNFYLCFVNDSGVFSCHLFDRIKNITYVGSDKIRSATSYRKFNYDLIIPIKEVIFNEILNMQFIEIAYFGVDGLLKKYNLEEYII